MKIDIWGSIVPHGSEEKMGDFSSLAMKYALEEANGSDVVIREQTMGGSIIEGMAIYNLLKNYEGKVTVQNMGMSGSIGSLIFLAGDTRIANKPSTFFMHEARGGRSDDLEMYNDMLASIYAEVSGKSKEFFREEMKKETSYNAQETFDLGFATELGVELKAVALMDFYESKPTNKKEPITMAMTKEEKAEFEALKVDNKALKDTQDQLVADKDTEIEALKAEQDSKVQEGIKAEKERESGIVAAILHPKQAEFAKTLIAEGKDLISASMAIMADFQANKAEFMKVTADEQITALTTEAPVASGQHEVEEEKPSIVAEWKAIKDPVANKTFFNENKEAILKGAK